MILFFLIPLGAGFLGAVFAPVGPCVASTEGYVASLAFRKAALRRSVSGGTSGHFLLPGLPLNSPARRDRALASLLACSASFGARRSPLHGTDGEVDVAPIT